MFLYCNLVAVRFGLIVQAEWFVGKTGFWTSQEICWQDHLWNDL